jgi:hypothetical protein
MKSHQQMRFQGFIYAGAALDRGAIVCQNIVGESINVMLDTT